MILVDAWRLAFVHVPKTGGCTISKALWRVMHGDALMPVSEHGSVMYRAMHEENHMHAVPRRHPGRGHWTLVGVKRNPWDRMASLHAHHSGGQEFEPWLQGGCGALHADGRRQQVDWLRHCDEVLRFEHLEDDWSQLLERLHLPATPLSHENAHDQAKAAHTATTCRLVRRMWPQDCGTLGYTAPVQEAA